MNATIENNELIRDQMNNVLDELIGISRCDICGCVIGDSDLDFQNNIENSDDCNYTIVPSYLDFSRNSRHRKIHCSSVCWMQSGARWGLDIRGHMPYDRKTKIFNDAIGMYYY